VVAFSTAADRIVPLMDIVFSFFSSRPKNTKSKGGAFFNNHQWLREAKSELPAKEDHHEMTKEACSSLPSSPALPDST
jgi:hypothetical protein